MGKRMFKAITFSLLLSSVAMFNTACNVGKVKITFTSENNSDIVRYMKKGKTLVDIPQVPSVKGKYCIWDREDFKHIKEDITVNAICYSTVTKLETNMPSEINVDVYSDEADLDYILKDVEFVATFESGETKKIYKDELVISGDKYNKNVSGTYQIGVGYNNAKHDVKINVNKLTNYVTVSLDHGKGYFNEGLPNLIANTDVEGSVAFDKGQTLYIGTNSYKWTFTPVDTNKYAVVKGNINVNLVNANSIILNKDSVTVDYGSTKEQIIDKIKEGLIVKGLYGNSYKEIDSKYYKIESQDFVVNRSGTFSFKVSYDQTVYEFIEVIVNKCSNYNLNVDDIEEFIVKENTTLNDVINTITYRSDVAGTIQLRENQTLGIGGYDYSYVFTPNDSNYEVKEGKLRIHTYKAANLTYTIDKEYVYGSKKEDIIQELKDSIEGMVEYNDSLTKSIDKSKVSITFLSVYNNLVPGSYRYAISYNDEIRVEDTILLNKRQLEQTKDYILVCEAVDPDNYETMPYCYIEKSYETKYDYDASLFTIIPIPDANIDVNGLLYKYKAELVPDDSISDIFDTVEIEVTAILSQPAI